MHDVTPKPAFLRDQIRFAMGRGLPAEAAEDVVFDAVALARTRFDPTRGELEPFIRRLVRNGTIDWWRQQGAQARATRELRLVDEPSDTAREEHAARCQQELLDALDTDERDVFAAWAVQKHLGKGQVSAASVGASLGLGPTEFENAKRRLKAKLHRLLDQFGWSVDQVLRGEDDARRTG